MFFCLFILLLLFPPVMNRLRQLYMCCPILTNVSSVDPSFETAMYSVDQSIETSADSFDPNGIRDQY